MKPLNEGNENKAKDGKCSRMIPILKIVFMIEVMLVMTRITRTNCLHLKNALFNADDLSKVSNAHAKASDTIQATRQKRPRGFDVCVTVGQGTELGKIHERRGNHSRKRVAEAAGDSSTRVSRQAS